MSETRPFSAASNKLAYAQAFTGTGSRRARRGGRRLHVPTLRRGTTTRTRRSSAAR